MIKTYIIILKRKPNKNEYGEMKEMFIQETRYGLCIYPYKKGMLKNLEKQNSIWDKVYHRNREVSGFIVPYDESGIQAYLTYYRNPELISTKGSRIYSLPVGFIKRMEGKFKLNEEESLTPIQDDLIHQIVGGKPYDDLSHNQWYINLSTGFGKTLTALYFASLIRYKTLILCYSRKILDQWMNTIDEKFQMEKDRYIYIDRRSTLLKFIDGKIKASNYDIILCTSGCIDNYGKKYGYSALKDLFDTMGIGLMIIDEAHRTFGRTIRICASVNIKYTLFLSADYAQGDYKKESMFLSAFQNTVYIAPPKDVQEEMKYTIGIVVAFDSHPNEIEQQTAIYTKQGYSPERYMEYELKKNTIYDTIIYIMKTIISVNEKHYTTLILATNIRPVEIITDFLKRHPVTGQLKIVKYYASMDKEEVEPLDGADIIIGTYGSFSTGINITTIRYVIGTNQSNKVEDNQTAGRAGRKFQLSELLSVYYFMLVDEGFSYCKKKLASRVNYLKEMKLKEIKKIKYISEGDDRYDVDSRI